MNALVPSVLLVDSDIPFRERLAHDFRNLGWEPIEVSCVTSARDSLKRLRPSLLVTELRIGHESWFDLLKSAQAISLERFVIATAYGSIASAVRAVRAGVATYLAKPVSAQNILDACSADSEESCPSESYCSLSRAKWEYIQLTFESCPSLAEAARRLGLDRRSLRRMLAQYAPE